MRLRWTRADALAFALAVLAGSVALAAPQGGGQTGQAGRGGQELGAGGQGRGGRGAMQRDSLRAVPTGTGVISGRVVGADTGRPLKRARVVVSGGGRPFSATTDEQGRYRITGLPAATYNVAVTKTGFIDAAYGQRRAMRPGTPLELADGQQLLNIDFRLSRGGVITGHVVDEDGEPLAQAMVTVLRNQYVGGEKRMTPAGFDQSDDRGQFRIFGLPPGDYFVSANAGGLERIVQQFVPALGGEQQPETSGYAPTYFPGTIAASEATKLKLAAAQETSGIDFQLQVVPFATVRGVVLGVASATVTLVPEGGGAAGGGGGLGGRGGVGRGGMGAAALGGGGLGGLIGQAVGTALQAAGSLRAQTQQDGTFTITGVTPGKYTIVARANDGGGRGGGASTAVQPLVVVGQEVSVTLTPSPGVDVVGTVTLEASGTSLPNGLSGFRINALAMDPTSAGARPPRSADAGQAGEFTMTGVTPGEYLIRGNGPRGWVMKSVFLNGTDVTDVPIDVGSSRVDGLNIIFSDKTSSLAGRVTDRGKPAAGLTVIAFSADEKLWYPQSRRIFAARTDATGAYRFASVPAGDYLVVAVDDVEQGEWFDPAYLEQIRDAATKVTVGEGEERTQDLRVQAS